MTEFVRIESGDDGVTTVRIDRPDVHNAFNEVVIAELTEAFAAVGADDAVRVVVLASAGMMPATAPTAETPKPFLVTEVCVTRSSQQICTPHATSLPVS